MVRILGTERLIPFSILLNGSKLFVVYLDPLVRLDFFPPFWVRFVASYQNS